MTRDFQRELASLREQYMAKVPAMLDELEAAISYAREHPSGIDNARSVLHRLHGTAGSYGATELSNVMAVMEEALTAPESPDWSRLDELLRAARAAEKAP